MINWKKLLIVANALDHKGFYNEADKIDNMLKSAMTPEEYELYYGKPKYEGSTIDKELDIKTPEGYKKYYGREMPKPEPKAEKVDVQQLKGDTLSNILQNISTMFMDSEYGFGSALLGIKYNEPGNEDLVVALQFDSSIVAKLFIDELPAAGFKLLAGGAEKQYGPGDKLKYGGHFMVVPAGSVPRVDKIVIMPKAPPNEMRKELIDTLSLARLYLGR